MEPFGLLKILTSLLETQKNAPPPATEAREAEEIIPSLEKNEERENAFLKLIENHEKRAKNVKKQRDQVLPNRSKTN